MDAIMLGVTNRAAARHAVQQPTRRQQGQYALYMERAKTMLERGHINLAARAIEMADLAKAGRL